MQDIIDEILNLAQIERLIHSQVFQCNKKASHEQTQ